MVAIELAASCSPFKRSKASATAISSQSVSGITKAPPRRSQVLQEDAADAVGDVLEAVDHLFQVVVDVGADDEVHRLRLAGLEKRLHAGVVDLVGPVLDAGHGLGDRVQPRGV